MRAVTVLFYCVFVLSPLPLGGNRSWAWLVLSAWLFLLLAAWGCFYLSGRVQLPSYANKSHVRVSVGLFFCFVLWSFLQSASIPADWLTQLPVPTAQLYQQAAAIISPQATLVNLPLSVDAGISFEIALRSTAYFCFYLLLLLLINNRDKLKKMCYVIVISGLFQAAYGGFMTLSGLEYVLGMKKYTYIGNATGTFINRNHFAGYLEMTLATGMGLMMINKKTSQIKSRVNWHASLRSILEILLSGKAVLRLILVVMVIGLILSRSRMGNGAFFNSLLIIGLAAMMSSPAFRKPRVYLLLLSVVAIDIFLLGRWFGIEKVISRMEQTSLAREGRDEIDQYVLPMISDYGLTGSGGGTFVYAFPPYLNGNYSGYNHAHNDYLEILCDFGYVGFFCLAAFVMLSLIQAIKALRHAKSSFIRGMGFAGLMGSMSLLIHASVDYNLQIPANVLLFITMLTIPTLALVVDKKPVAITREVD